MNLCVCVSGGLRGVGGVSPVACSVCFESMVVFCGSKIQIMVLETGTCFPVSSPIFLRGRLLDIVLVSRFWSRTSVAYLTAAGPGVPSHAFSLLMTGVESYE